MGAGRAIPIVRNLSVRNGPRVIRINPGEFHFHFAKNCPAQPGSLSWRRCPVGPTPSSFILAT